MFRTGHRTDPAPSAETMAEPTRIEPKTVEAEAAKTPTAPAAERSAARPMPMDRPGTEAVLGKGVTFDGTLRFTGALRIDGTFKGQILAGDSLLIGEGADVAADITCGTIKVSGEARGSLTATRSLELKAPAHIAARPSARPSRNQPTFRPGEVLLNAMTASRPRHSCSSIQFGAG